MRRCMMIRDPLDMRRSSIARIVLLLAAGFVLAVAIALSLVYTRFVTAVNQNEDTMPPNVDANVRGVDFDFLDHELRYAGGYVVSPAPVVAKGADFDFLDHELRYAGGYVVSPAPVVAKGADFDFLDHELRYAGGYGLQPSTAHLAR
jgi:hypothetical protein